MAAEESLDAFVTARIDTLPSGPSCSWLRAFRTRIEADHEVTRLRAAQFTMDHARVRRPYGKPFDGDYLVFSCRLTQPIDWSSLPLKRAPRRWLHVRAHGDTAAYDLEEVDASAADGAARLLRSAGS